MDIYFAIVDNFMAKQTILKNAKLKPLSIYLKKKKNKFMITMTKEEQLKLSKKLLENTQLQLIELLTTRDFNKKALAENPTLQDKINPLILTIGMDIRQTVSYIEFIKEQISSLNKLEKGFKESYFGQKDK